MPELLDEEEIEQRIDELGDWEHEGGEIHKVFEFDDFASAWDVLAGVTAARLKPERAEQAKAAVRAMMWPSGDGPRRFRNETQFIIGRRARSL